MIAPPTKFTRSGSANARTASSLASVTNSANTPVASRSGSCTSCLFTRAATDTKPPSNVSIVASLGAGYSDGMSSGRQSGERSQAPREVVGGERFRDHEGRARVEGAFLEVGRALGRDESERHVARLGAQRLEQF